MSNLSIYKKIMAFDDENSTNAPKLQVVNWNRDTIRSVPVEAPANEKYVLSSLATKAVFNGTVSLSYDNTTQFAVSLSSLSPSRYRLTWAGGTDPQFRTSRTLSLSGGSLTITVQSNQTVVVTHSAGSVFGDVEVGDDVFIPGVSTGDTALFNTLNEGHWVVLDATNTQLTLVRETGSLFEGYAETVSITTNSQVLAYSSAGVQIDNVIGFVSGFAASLLHSYEIVQVTSKWLEFESSAPLPTQTVTPGTNSLVIYNNAKRYLYIETDQEVAVVINGNSQATVVPFQTGNSNMPGVYELSGVVYSLSLINKSTQQATVRVISAE